MIQNCTGIVLKQKIWGEKDLLLSVLSEEGHLKEWIVKGAGSGNSKRRSHLELMNKIRGTLYINGKNHYLQSVECVESFYHLKQDFKRVFAAQLFLEVIKRSLVPEDPYPAGFQLLERTFEHLNGKDPCPLGVEIGLVKWGELLGILPNFRTCGACHQWIKEIARWNGEKQVLLCEPCGGAYGEELELKYRKALEFFKTASFHECRNLTLKESESSKLRELIPYFFRDHLDQPLKSLPMARIA